MEKSDTYPNTQRELDPIATKVRPICLLNELGKIMERIIDGRIKDWMENNPSSRLAVNQFGFKRNTSTCDALLIVKEIIEEAKVKRESVVCVSLDVTNAFNSLKWPKIRLALKNKGFPSYLRKIIGDYLRDRFIEYPTIEGNTVLRKITAGVPQGSVLGPTLWNITYDYVLRTPFEEGCIIIGYADDTFIISTATTTEEAIVRSNLQLSRTMRRIRHLELEIAENKTGRNHR